MKKLYLFPNMVTACALICGLFVIFKVNMIEPGAGYYEVMKISAFLLILSAFLDFIDGAVARILHAESEFGFVFDSLADAVSFGVAPSVLVLKSLSLEPGTALSFIVTISAMIFSVCGILRLVRFNVKKAEAKGNLIEMTAQKKNFTGLPIPAAALACVSANLFLLSPHFEKIFGSPINQNLQGIILACVMAVLGFFMVSKWKFPSLKALNLSMKPFPLVLSAVLVMGGLIFGGIYFFPVALLGISWGYFLVGGTLSLIRYIAGKKSKTLEDFEPEEEEFVEK
jgi:CDP-diacylglycerol--serine O-phosphatidyltransferase